MFTHKYFNALRQLNKARAAKLAVKSLAVVFALALLTVAAVPSLRHSFTAQLDSGANLFLFDGDVDEESTLSGDAAPDSATPKTKKPNSVKRVVTAPVRFFARLFKGRNNDVARKTTEKDAEKMKMIPVSRTEDGVPGEIADTAGTAREASTAEAAAQNLFDDAVRLHDKGRLDGAIEKLVAATVLQSNFAEAFNLLAVCYDEKSQYRSAQEEYKKALKLDSNNARFLNNLGYSYYLAGDNGNAIKWYGKGLKITPNDRRMHNNIGLAYGRKGEYDKARQHFIIAVGETGSNLNLGYVYSQQGKFDEAIKHYESALRSQPNSLPALSNLARLYERTGRLSEAGALNEQYKKLAVAAQQKDQTVDQDQ
jgi:tetratricopeptide (TPR) repeat protein